MTKRLLPLLAVCALLLLPTSAQAATAPPLDVHTARAYEDVMVAGDLLVFGRIELEVGTWTDGVPSGGWADFGASAALARLSVGGVSVQDRIPARVGHGLAGFYLEPGHGIDWGDEAAAMRLVSNPGVFSTPSSAERALDWIDMPPGIIAQSPSLQGLLCDHVRQELQALANADSTDPLTQDGLIAGQVVTAQGALLAQEAFAAFPSLLTGCFEVSISGSGQTFDPGDPVLRDDRVAEVEATAMWLAWAAFAETYDLHPVYTATFLWVGLAFAVMIIISAIPALGPMFGVPAGGLTAFTGALFVPHFLMQVVLLGVGILLILAGFFVLARVPR